MKASYGKLYAVASNVRRPEFSLQPTFEWQEEFMVLHTATQPGEENR
jgi:hypothetical protein